MDRRVRQLVDSSCHEVLSEHLISYYTKCTKKLAKFRPLWSPHCIEETLILSCIHNDIPRNGLRETFTDDLMSLKLLQYYEKDHGGMITEDRFVDLVCFTQPSRHELLSHAVDMKHIFDLDERKIVKLIHSLWKEWPLHMEERLNRIHVGRKPSDTTCKHNDSVWHNRIDENYIERDAEKVDIIRTSSKTKLVAHIVQANHMRDQLYMQIRLPVVFEYTRNGKLGKNTISISLLNVAFVGPKDQWYPLRSSVRTFRIREYDTKSLSLVGMTFYALTFFNDPVSTEKMHASAFYAIMAYLYEITDPVRETLGARVKRLKRWHPLERNSSFPTFLRQVSDRTCEVSSTLQQIDPRANRRFRRNVHAVYKVTMNHIRIALHTDNGLLSNVSFVSPNVMEDDPIQ